MHQKQHHAHADLRVMCVELRTFVHVIWRRAALFSAAKPHFFPAGLRQAVVFSAAKPHFFPGWRLIRRLTGIVPGPMSDASIANFRNVNVFTFIGLYNIVRALRKLCAYRYMLNF